MRAAFAAADALRLCTGNGTVSPGLDSIADARKRREHCDPWLCAVEHVERVRRLSTAQRAGASHAPRGRSIRRRALGCPTGFELRPKATWRPANAANMWPASGLWL